MPRVKNGVAHHARKKKIMEAAKGARGGRSKLYKSAKETAERAMRYAYRGRRRASFGRCGSPGSTRPPASRA
jgi:large subunit ribosomal protein L20